MSHSESSNEVQDMLPWICENCDDPVMFCHHSKKCQICGQRYKQACTNCKLYYPENGKHLKLNRRGLCPLDEDTSFHVVTPEEYRHLPPGGILEGDYEFFCTICGNPYEIGWHSKQCCGKNLYQKCHCCNKLMSSGGSLTKHEIACFERAEEATSEESEEAESEEGAQNEEGAEEEDEGAEEEDQRTETDTEEEEEGTDTDTEEEEETGTDTEQEDTYENEEVEGSTEEEDVDEDEVEVEEPATMEREEGHVGGGSAMILRRKRRKPQEAEHQGLVSDSDLDSDAMDVDKVEQVEQVDYSLHFLFCLFFCLFVFLFVCLFV